MTQHVKVWVAWWYDGDFDGGTEVFRTEAEAETYLKRINRERPASTHMVRSVAARFVMMPELDRTVPVRISEYLEADLSKRFGNDLAARADFLTRFVGKHEADVTNWSGLEYCPMCGEDIEDDSDDAVYRDGGETYHAACYNKL
jgi:hypothetical protein